MLAILRSECLLAKWAGCASKSREGRVQPTRDATSEELASDNQIVAAAPVRPSTPQQEVTSFLPVSDIRMRRCNRKIDLRPNTYHRN
jgi:hypothetical protein